MAKQAIASGFARVFGAQPALPHGHVVAVESDITKGLHAFSIVGLPDKSIEEAKDRIASAIKNSGLESPKRSNKKIIISLAPATLKKEGGAFDLPMALSFLLASEQTKFNPEGKMFAGELALDGAVRPVLGALSIAIAARNGGFTELYLPEENIEEASLIPDLKIYPVRSLEDVLQHFTKDSKEVLVAHTRGARSAKENRNKQEGPILDDIRGQESAKRGLEIAAAGRHNIALYGPPGTGKTMLARAATALLPELSLEETIEVTTIHSLAGSSDGHAIEHPPFRSPHHTSSYASLIGGGSNPRPGEVTLAHRGVLFLDDVLEKVYDSLES